jgi:hypothetical protein
MCFRLDPWNHATLFVTSSFCAAGADYLPRNPTYDRRSVDHMNVVKLAPGMGPTRHFINGAAFIEMMKAGIMWRAT